MKLILVRHCETDWNTKGRLQGLIDRELNATGRRQAQELAEEVESFGISRIVSSDLRREVQTAELISEYLGIQIKFDERLRECSFGKFEGLTWSDVEETFNVKKEFYYRGAEHDYDFSPVGGESRNNVINRHIALLEKLAKSDRGEKILIIGHGTGLNSLLHLLGYPIGLKRGEYREIEYS